MAYQLNLHHLDLAYSGGAFEGKWPRRFVPQHAGNLDIADGQLAASDPLVEPEPLPFTQSVPNGSFPVTLAIGVLENGDERVAYARVDFSSAKPVRWEMALVGGQDHRELEADSFFGYGVDAGTGCFMGVAASRDLARAMDKVEDYFESIIDGMDATYKHTRSWYAWKPDTAGSENIVCFSSGYGDGCYPSFFGYDAAGNAVALVTDFLTLSDPEQED